jgi:hypothetical protein
MAGTGHRHRSVVLVGEGALDSFNLLDVVPASTRGDLESPTRNTHQTTREMARFAERSPQTRATKMYILTLGRRQKNPTAMNWTTGLKSMRVRLKGINSITEKLADGTRRARPTPTFINSADRRSCSTGLSTRLYPVL